MKNENYTYQDDTLIFQEGVVQIEEGDYPVETRRIEIPSSVKEISARAFFNLAHLESVLFSEGLEVIGDMAFSECFSLEELNLPDSLRIIKNKVFADCVSLRQVRIPKGIEEIGTQAFFNCQNLQRVEMMGASEGLSDDDSCNAQIQNDLSKDKFPISNLKTIEQGTFQKCFSLEEILLPEGIETIGFDAFEGCSRLTSFRYPSSLKEIREGAFVGCLNLKPQKKLKNVRIDSHAYRESWGTRVDNWACRGTAEQHLGDFFGDFLWFVATAPWILLLLLIPVILIIVLLFKIL